MGPTFGARHVVLLLQITRTKVENKSENSYIRHYLAQQLSSDTDKARWQVATQRGQLQLFAFYTEVWKFEFLQIEFVGIKSRRKKRGDHQQRHSRKRGFQTLSLTVLIWWDNTTRALGWKCISPLLTAINVFMWSVFSMIKYWCYGDYSTAICCVAWFDRHSYDLIVMVERYLRLLLIIIYISRQRYETSLMSF